MNNYLLIVDNSLPSLSARNWAKKRSKEVEVVSVEDFKIDLSVNKPPIFIKRSFYGLIQGVVEGFKQDKYERLMSND
ncbi:hypothetical protein [Nosocomiicoccus ampullae]|uniref:hypothetical protein n=1 Tax=Nosocomiicoccus ampullae TaxID=489910 RepID=UPI001C5E22DD|nr:hypothetical protein [Nosocomiicoccus ampullae]QYA47972.1 hypothetical protein KPF52_05815 [Nosocomiicoccus ampullae]